MSFKLSGCLMSLLFPFMFFLFTLLEKTFTFNLFLINQLLLLILK